MTQHTLNILIHVLFGGAGLLALWSLWSDIKTFWRRNVW